MDKQYTRRIEKIESALSQWLPENPGPEWIEKAFPGLTGVDPSMIQSLTAPARDILSRGGKRWRPLLMTLVCETLGGGDAAIPYAPLVEFCHNASLIHDDIEDCSDERRGKPAVHIIHGEDTAINGGCFLYFLPLACIDSAAEHLPPTARPETAAVYALWAQSMRKLHLGQAIDIHWHRETTAVPSAQEYYAMCKLKTGCLARFAAELGALAATAAAGKTLSKEASLFAEAAEKLGVGFQIFDDVKNLTTGIPGKKRGDDIVEGKKSLPILLFLGKYPEKRETVFRCFEKARSSGAAAPEVEELIGELHTAGVLAEAEERGKTLIEEARAAFAGTESAPAETAESRKLLAGLPGLLA